MHVLLRALVYFTFVHQERVKAEGVYTPAEDRLLWPHMHSWRLCVRIAGYSLNKPSKSWSVCTDRKQWDNLNDSWHFYRRLFSPRSLHALRFDAFQQAAAPSICWCSLCAAWYSFLSFSEFNITAGVPRDRFLDAKPPRQPVQPFSKIDPKIQHSPQISLQTFEVKSFCRHRMTKMERLLFKNVTDGFPACSALKREMVLIDEPIHSRLFLLQVCCVCCLIHFSPAEVIFHPYVWHGAVVPGSDCGCLH